LLEAKIRISFNPNRQTKKIVNPMYRTQFLFIPLAILLQERMTICSPAADLIDSALANNEIQISPKVREIL
jgi:hypothetical protein